MKWLLLDLVIALSDQSLGTPAAYMQILCNSAKQLGSVILLNKDSPFFIFQPVAQTSKNKKN